MVGVDIFGVGDYGEPWFSAFRKGSSVNDYSMENLRLFVKIPIFFSVGMADKFESQ